MAKRGIEYRAIGIKIKEHEGNWLSFEYGGCEVTVAEAGLRHPVYLIRIGSDVEEAAQSVIEQADDYGDDAEKVVVRMYRLLGKTKDEEDFLLIDPGPGAKSQPVLLAYNGKVKTWERIKDRRFSDGRRWDRRDDYGEGEKLFVFLSEKKGTGTVSQKKEV